MKQYGAIDDTIYFWFAGNDTSGSGGDGASPAADVRLAGAAANAAPVYSPTPSLLSHAGYPAGAYEIAIAATAANGFAATNTYAVFCTLAIDSQNPTGFVGSFDLKPVDSNIIQYLDSAAEVVPDANVTHIHGNALTESVDGYLAAAFVKLFDVATPLLVASTAMRGTDSAALAATALTDATWTNAKAAFLDASIGAIPTTAMRGTDGANTTVPDAAGVAPTAAEIKTEIEQAGSSLAQILTDTGTTLPATLTGIEGATFDTGTDSLEAIRNRGDAAWVTGAGGSAPTVGEIRAEMEGAGYNLALILADTGELQADWTNGGRLDQIQDIIAADTTTDIPALIAALENLSSAQANAACDTALSDYGANTTVPDAAGVAPTAAEIKTEIEQAGSSLAQILTDTGTTLPATLTGIEGATFDTGTDSLEAIRNRGDAAWSAAAGNPNVLIDTTIASVTDQTHFTLMAGSDIDDAYKDQAVVVYDASNNDYPSVRKISAYTGATKTVTLDSAPDFTIVNGDGVKTFVTAPGTTAPTVGQIRAEMEGAGYNLALILADTAELQGNQAAWATATGFSTHSAADVKTAIEAAGSNLALILADTGEIQTDWTNGGRLDLIQDIIAADTTTDIPALIATAQADLDTITGSDGVTLATAQALYAPNKVVPDAAGTAAGLHTTTDGKVDVVDANVDAILVDTGTSIPADIAALNDLSSANVTAACTSSFNTYDPPTRTEATSDKDTIITEVNANETKIDTLQTDSTAIKAKTDNLPSGIAKNVALSDFNVYMVLSSDHVTAATGKTLTGTISKDGATFNALTNAISEIAAGMYKVDLTQAEMNADVVTVKFTETDCDQRIITIYTS